ncbi:MAG: LD-carboxypeptidase [Acidobacteriota bacterium]|nr:LD-carboxypeptidase [Acidobacteriota bacterium]
MSPSSGVAGLFPLVHERGVAALASAFDLEFVEFPTTRQPGASAHERARDLNAAFADPSIRAIMATLGGSDQITVLPHLDPSLLGDDPPAFFGYSDNTNLLLWLWHHGVSSYHGGSTLVHMARPGGPHDAHLASLRHALFDDGRYEILPQPRFTDLQGQWEEPTTLDHELATFPESGWYWRGDHVVTGVTWGGNLEILHWNLAANRWIGANDDFTDGVLLLETSEEMPEAEEVSRMLRNMGERGLLERFAAVVMAKAKAWSTERPLGVEAREEYRRAQRDVLVRACDTYAPHAVVVYGPDFGHTDPQIVVPFGATMTVDPLARKIWANY